MNAYLILCHHAPMHILVQAQRHRKSQFYLHYDAKSPLIKLDKLTNEPNIHLIRHRIDVHWGGFSMIEATLALIQAALANKDNHYFHLISGDCAPLLTPEQLANECAQQPSKEICLSGSQWFSANRAALSILFDESLGEAAAHFEKKLVPDEHFFQYIVAKNAEKFNHINNNYRFIRFSAGANHPDFLTLDELQEAKKSGAWFARKVPPEQMIRWLNDETRI